MKAYRYRIYPNAVQQALLEQHFGCARHGYHWALDLKSPCYQEQKKSSSNTGDLVVGACHWPFEIKTHSANTDFET